MRKSEVFTVLNRTNTELSIHIKGLGVAKVLFFLTLIVFCFGLYASVLFYVRYSTQFKLPVLISSYFLIGVGLSILLKMMYNFFYQGFDFIYIFEKSSTGKIFLNTTKGGFILSRVELPNPVDFLDFQVRDFGMFGFQVFAFGNPSKQNILKGNFLTKFSNIILQSPLIRVEFRYNSPTETKEESRALLFEIRSFIRNRSIEKPQKKNPLMKLGLTVEEVKDWVKKGIDVNERDAIIGNPVLFYAAGTDPELPPFEWQEPNYPVIAELIRSGADVNSCNFYNERVLDYIVRCTAQTGENPSIQRLKSFLESYGYRKY